MIIPEPGQLWTLSDKHGSCIDLIMHVDHDDVHILRSSVGESEDALRDVFTVHRFDFNRWQKRGDYAIIEDVP